MFFGPTIQKLDFPRKSMRTKNQNILFVGPDPSRKGGYQPGGQITAALSLIDYLADKDLEIYAIDTYIPAFPKITIFRKVFKSLNRLFECLKMLLKGKHSIMLLFVGARLSFYERSLQALMGRVFGLHIVFCIRDGHFSSWANSSFFTKGMTKLLIQIPSVFVVQGSSLSNTLTELGLHEDKVRVVPNWLPFGYQLSDQPKVYNKAEGPLKLVFVGWLIEEKGLIELIDAMMMLDKSTMVSLDIIGDGVFSTVIREIINIKGLENVFLHGWQSTEAVKKIASSCHVFVLPSHFEGFPNALIEAMSSGLPPIVTDVGAITDTVVDAKNGFIVPVKAKKCIADAIMKYVNSPHLVEQHSLASLMAISQRHDKKRNLELFSSILTNE